eukprot:TRINITY_DN6576_c0_g1_i2.p1 TRINITY_DN6576_c0_g1~~TRINITY_DN6576_c0_g1_i2.p1  ORF type:complete len:270 (+),score=61.85 TRINITY_DN6576_c0_g1_i2:27-812(+)
MSTEADAAPVVSEGSGQAERVWAPLEGNPEVLTRLAEELGAPPGWGFSDCYGLDMDTLAMSPQPVLAVLLVFSVRAMEDYANERQKEEDTKDEKEDQTGAPAPDSSVYFMRQIVGGACGTIALIHCLVNNRDPFLPLQEHSPLHQLLSDSATLDFTQRGAMLRESQGIFQAHQNAAAAGQTRKPRARARPKRTGFHFLCFVRGPDDALYELDGRKPAPVRHGQTSPDMLLYDAARVIQEEYIAKSKEALKFTVLTLGPTFQ